MACVGSARDCGRRDVPLHKRSHGNQCGQRVTAQRLSGNPGVREVGWIDSGGGYSILFPRPAFQNTLPAGSTYVGSSVGAPGPNSNMRGVPDIAFQASARTGPLVYDGVDGGW